MARRAIWKGAVSFGLVAIPIKLYTSTESKDLSFRMLHSVCNSRIRQKRYCSHHDVEVDRAEIVRAYEYSRDEYVVMSDSDFENLPVASTRVIEITQFVDLAEIDPINFERPYVLEPEGFGTKPFYLLKQALDNSGRVAIGKVSLREKEHICCLRPYDRGIAMHTMHYPDEIRGIAELDLPEEQTAITQQEMAMAMTLIDQLTGPYDPSQYRDEYRLTLERVIEGKLTSQQPVTAPPAAPKGKVTDLMEALRASIAATKKQRPETAEENQAESRPKRRKADSKARSA